MNVGGYTIDESDEDMVDAALLATPDGMGSSWWRPSRLEDIYEMPDRVVRLFLAYRAGMAAAQNKKASPVGQGTIGGVEVT